MVERIVRYMFVPVSPSGTGKTLMAFTESAWRSSQPVAAANMSRSWRPDRASIVTEAMSLPGEWGRGAALLGGESG